MKLYLYADGFAGFLSAAAAAYGSGLAADECGFQSGEVPAGPDLFAEPVFAPTDERAALKLWEELDRTAGCQARRLVRAAHAHAWEAGRDRSVYACIYASLRRGRAGLDRLSDAEVLSAHKRAERVLLEVHKFQGLVRLRKTSDGMFYAPINPDHDILAFLSLHFSRRYRDQSCLLHDLRRGKAAVCRAGRVDFLNFQTECSNCREPAPRYEAADDELLYQRLWRDYFSSIAIQERRNPELQRRHVPIRYREFLVEFD